MIFPVVLNIIIIAILVPFAGNGLDKSQAMGEGDDVSDRRSKNGSISKSVLLCRTGGLIFQEKRGCGCCR